LLNAIAARSVDHDPMSPIDLGREMQLSALPLFEDIAAAARRLSGHAVVTPLLYAAALSEATGGSIWVKAENLQVCGAFKFRGAFNRLSQLSAAERARGAVAWSSGNHAQGVAAAGRRLTVPSTIVMPRDAPQTKVRNTKRLGAEIVFYDRYTENREQIGHALAAERGATIVPPFDDPHIIAGQGTVALELVAQATQMGLMLDALLVPCGGGGLIGGCALAVSGASPRTQVHAVEPENFDDTARSLATGTRQRVSADARTICDALMAPTPGEMTFEINRRLVASGLRVTDEAVCAAMSHAWDELKLVVEPGGAVGLAAVLAGAFDCRGKTVAIVLSGGNVDAEVFSDALRRAKMGAGAGGIQS
jgi:threonine dehydratase